MSSHSVKEYAPVRICAHQSNKARVYGCSDTVTALCACPTRFSKVPDKLLLH